MKRKSYLVNLDGQFGRIPDTYLDFHVIISGTSWEDHPALDIAPDADLVHMGTVGPAAISQEDPEGEK